jgi:hypothetical protein
MKELKEAKKKTIRDLSCAVATLKFLTRSTRAWAIARDISRCDYTILISR